MPNQIPFPTGRKERLFKDGYLRVPGAVPSETLAEMLRAVRRLEEQYPFGFLHNGNYSDKPAAPRMTAPRPTDEISTIIYPNVGFMEPVLLAPLADAGLLEIVESVVGKDFYFSNTWMQAVPPGTGRMGFHKDPRGSLSFTLLLDDIDPEMGSTCLVPGSHLNTPPSIFSMKDIGAPYPGEVDLWGKAGDILFFSAEAWHGRAANKSPKTTRRLFYNFYSRSSKVTTSWAKAVSQEQVDRVKASLPETLHPMFRIDAALTQRLQSDGIDPADNDTGARSHDQIPADIAHARRTHGKSSLHPEHPGYLRPYTTRLTEQQPFNLMRYLGCLKAVPTLKAAARKILRR